MTDGFKQDMHRDKIFVTNGCTNHSEGVRDTNDYYATPPYALEKLLDVIDFELPKKVWECCVGGAFKSCA